MSQAFQSEHYMKAESKASIQAHPAHNYESKYCFSLEKLTFNTSKKLQ